MARRLALKLSSGVGVVVRVTRSRRGETKDKSCAKIQEENTQLHSSGAPVRSRLAPLTVVIASLTHLVLRMRSLATRACFPLRSHRPAEGPSPRPAGAPLPTTLRPSRTCCKRKSTHNRTLSFSSVGRPAEKTTLSTALAPAPLPATSPAAAHNMRHCKCCRMSLGSDAPLPPAQPNGHRGARVSCMRLEVVRRAVAPDMVQNRSHPLPCTGFAGGAASPTPSPFRATAVPP